MNRDDIIRMAREAGLRHHLPFPDDSHVEAALTRFAALVAAAEREACAKVCEKLPNSDYDGYGNDGEAYADAIRARGQQ